MGMYWDHEPQDWSAKLQLRAFLARAELELCAPVHGERPCGPIWHFLALFGTGLGRARGTLATRTHVAHESKPLTRLIHKLSRRSGVTGVAQVSKPAVSLISQSAERRNDGGARRLGNLRYGRPGGLRYSEVCDIPGLILSGETIVEESWRFEIPFTSGAFSSPDSH